MTLIELPARPGDGSASGESAGSFRGGEQARPALPSRVVAIALLVVLVVAAVATVTFLAFGGGVREYPTGSPEATIQAYVRALDSGDPSGAWALLSARQQASVSEERFAWLYGLESGADRVVLVDRTSIGDDRATVDLTVEVYDSSDLTPSRTTRHPVMSLVREDGVWKLDRLYLGPELLPARP